MPVYRVSYRFINEYKCENASQIMEDIFKRITTNPNDVQKIYDNEWLVAYSDKNLLLHDRLVLLFEEKRMEDENFKFLHLDFFISEIEKSKYVIYKTDSDTCTSIVDWLYHHDLTRLRE